MRTIAFPHCCTAKLMVDFGESDLAEGGGRKVKYNEIKTKIDNKMKSLYSESLAMFTAITNSEQLVANKVLLDLGFSHSKWISKKAHPETKVRLWWKAISDLDK